MLINIVGPYDRSMLSTGDIITLRVEHDEFNSISALFNNVIIGKVAEASNFTVNKLKSSELRELLLDDKVEIDCEVIGKEDVFYKNNTKDQAVTCEVIEKIKEEENELNMGGINMNKVIKHDIVLGGNFEESRAKLTPAKAMLEKKDISNLKLELVEHNKVMHVVIAKDSDLYVKSEDISDNSIGILDTEDKEVLSIVDSLDSFSNIEVTFKEAKGVNNIITLSLSGNALLKGLDSEGTDFDFLGRIEHMNSIGIPTKMKEKALKLIRRDTDDLSLEVKGRIPNKGFQYIPQKTELIQVMGGYHSGLNILLEGNKASGKNTLIEDIGFLYNQPVFELQVNAEINNSDILGMKSIEPVIDLTGEMEEKLKAAIPMFFEGLNKPELLENEAYKEASALVVKSISGGETRVVYEPSPLIEAMEKGGILVLDEINTGHPSILSILNPILDNRKRIDVPGYKPVIAHPDFRVFATMNKGYAGTMGMNSATHSRFMVVEMEPARSIRDIILKEFPEIEKELLAYLDRVYKEILKGTMGKNATLTADAINIRAFKNAVNLIEEGVNVKSAFDLIASSSQDDYEREAIRNIIRAILP